jgi:hypothetical protein
MIRAGQSRFLLASAKVGVEGGWRVAVVLQWRWRSLGTNLAE